MSHDLIDKAEEHFAAGRLMEAEGCLQEALKVDASSKTALNNLGVVYFQQQKYDKSLGCFTKILADDPLYRDALINLAVFSEALDQTDLALAGLRSYAEKFPQDGEIGDLIARLTSHDQVRRRIAVLCLPGLKSFLGDIVHHLEQSHEVQTCFTTDEQKIAQAVNWADTIWLEWANELAVAVTTHPHMLEGKRVLCRLHSYEAFSPFVGQIRWDRINDLLFVAPHIRDHLLAQLPDLQEQVERIYLVPNGVDLDRYTLQEKPFGKNLAFLGSINYKKGPLLLLHAFAELVRRDPEYRLFIGGNFQDDRFLLYYRQMSAELGVDRNLFFDGWVEDVPAWLDDKHQVVCSSVLEGHPVGLLEAMACGLRPLVHNFVGARDMYPAGFLWNSIEDFVQHATDDRYEPAEYRRFVSDNYSLKRQLAQIDKVIALPQKTPTSSAGGRLCI